jgi:hypothetical protein
MAYEPAVFVPRQYRTMLLGQVCSWPRKAPHVTTITFPIITMRCRKAPRKDRVFLSVSEASISEAYITRGKWLTFYRKHVIFSLSSY